MPVVTYTIYLVTPKNKKIKKIKFIAVDRRVDHVAIGCLNDVI